MSVILSSRVKKILKFILSSRTYITIKDIADEILVSRRTILREMDDVYEWLQKKQVVIHKMANKGFMVDIKESERLLLLESLNNELEDYLYTKDERRVFIVSELLLNKEPSKLFYFADMLNVSEATISHDLDGVEDWLKKYEIQLERRQGMGVFINGKERSIRKALITIIYDNLDEEQVQKLMNNYINVLPGRIKQESNIKKKLLDLIDQDTIASIQNAIDNSEMEMGFKFAESSYTALAVHLALAIKRIEKGEKISIPTEIFESYKMYDEFHIAANLIDSLRSVLNIDIPEEEIGYVTMHLKGAKYKSGLTDTSVLKFNEIIISNYKLTSIIYQMIKIAEEETGYSLSKNDSLLIGMVDHLRPAINRIQMNLDIRNPLLDVIKEKYPLIYQTSEKCAKILESQLNLSMPESEIGYIAMHLGSAIERIKNNNYLKDVKYRIVVTCTSGIGTSKMLAERIKHEFQNIDIIDVFSSTSVTDEWIYKQKIDLIVSTVYFDNSKVPVVVVNPLLLENDIDKLKQKLSTITIVHNINQQEDHVQTVDVKERLQKLNSYSSGIIDIINHFSLEEGIDAENFTKFLSEATKRIHGDRKKSKYLMKEIEKREQIGSVVFKEEQVILLHTRTMTTDELQVKVFRNNKKIIYGKYIFQSAIFMLAPTDVEKEKLEVIGEISAKLVNNPSFLHKIKKANETVLKEYIEKIITDFFNDKFQQ